MSQGLRGTVGSLLAAARLGKFLSVGVCGALIDNAVLFLLVEFAAFPPVAGGAVSKELSIVTMFLINDRWTFPEFDGGGSVWRRLVRSNVLRLGGLAVGLGTLYVLNTYFGVWYIAANVIGIGVGFVVNYVAESIFTWRVHD